MGSPSDRRAQTQALAAQLDRLRLDAGFESARKLAAQTYLSHPVIAAALKGEKLPSATAVAEIARACGADTIEWEARRSRAAATSAHSEGRHTHLPPTLMPATDEPADAIDYGDPDDAGCSADALSMHSRRLTRTGERRRVGFVELRYSPSTRAVWGRFGGFDLLDALAGRRDDVIIDLAVHRASDNASARFRQTYAFDLHWSGLLLADGQQFWASAAICFGDSRIASGSTDRLTLPG